MSHTATTRPATAAEPTAHGVRRPTARAVFALAWPVALLILGALGTATAWHRISVSLLFALCAALPLLLLRGALALGVSRWAATSLLVLLTLLLGYLMTAGADLSLEHTVRDSVPRLLTAPQPYAFAPDLLVGPLLLVVLVSLLVGLRVDGHTLVVPVAGAALLYVAGALLTAGSGDPWGLEAMLLLVVAVLGWVFLDEHSEPARQRLSVAAPLSVLAVAALAAVATLPLHQPFEPRDLVDPPTVSITATNPLSQLGAWAHNPDVPLLRVSGDDVPLRLVVLDDYDGRQWSASTSFQHVDTDGRTDLAIGPYARTAAVQVQFDGLGGSWLPSPGTPSLVGLGDALIDPGTGTLLTQDPTAGLGYQVAATYDDPPDRTLEGASVTAGTDFYRHYTALPPLTAPLAEYSKAVVQGAVSPYQRAVAIDHEIRGDNTLAGSAISGSALWRLQSFLLGTKGSPGAREGTSEQFASAFAVVARYNGLPARVVVGFKPGTTQDDGSRLITGSDALAWAEVHFDGLGWVPFSPTPDDDTFAAHQVVRAQQPDLPQAAATDGPTAGPGATTAPDAAPRPTAQPAAAADSGLPSWAPYALAGAVVLLLVLSDLALRALRRRRHRRHGAAGAWAEVLDALRLAGMRPPAWHTAEQIAADADRRLRLDDAVPLAHAAERESFAPDPEAFEDRDSRQRQHLRAVRSAARGSLPLWRRWWWPLDPRVLVPARTARSGRPAQPRPGGQQRGLPELPNSPVASATTR